ncbi:uncharacterized protein LOC111084400, partial [Limulus polyphemus]|uniref:Uncharacterized protein LOC111084400 n=1 Tax=Limulus polyphemus TaxID=6850 RepID=A0ABM1RZM5_LIMPO
MDILSSLQQPDYNPDNLSELCNDVYTKYQVTTQQANNLETATRNQSISSLWYQHRMGRITASQAHDVLTRRVTTPADNLVKRIVGYSTYNLSSKNSVKWGIDHEEECRNAYVQHQQSTHTSFTCVPSGFVIDTNHPFLGASPDGIVSCQCCGKGTLE